MSDEINLAKEECQPCKGLVLPMGPTEASELLQSLDKSWSINSLGHLERLFLVKGFMPAINIANKFAQIAEKAKHHPDFHISYGKILVEIWTHKINGLSRADFVLAAKIDEAAKEI